MKKAYFQYYETFENIVQKFRDTEDREFLRGIIIRYGLFGEEPDGLSENFDLAFTVIKELIDDQVRRREVNAENRRLKIAATKPELEQKPTIKKFAKPTVEEIAAYCKERNNNINPQSFFDFYESKGWKVGNAAMKDWKSCVRTWEQRRAEPSTFGAKTHSSLPDDRLTL